MAMTVSETTGTTGQHSLHSVPAIPVVSRVDTAAMGLGELMALAQQVAEDLAGRLCASDLIEVLVPAAGAAGSSYQRAAHPKDAAVTLLDVQTGVGRLARVVEVAQTAVAGVTDQVLQDPQSRQRLLGLPAGKSRFRNAAEFLEQTQHTPRRDTHTRVDRAAHHLPTPGSDVDPQSESAPGRGVARGAFSEVSGAWADGTVDPSVIDMITRTLTTARQTAVQSGAAPDVVDRLIHDGQQRLLAQARHSTPSAVSQACRRWRGQFDQLLAEAGATTRAEGVHPGRSAKFVREESGLYLWQLWLTQAQHEVIHTVTSAGTNPRAVSKPSSGPQPTGLAAPTGSSASDQGLFDLEAAVASASAPATAGGTEPAGDAPEDSGFVHPGMLRTQERGRQQVDAIISALTAALRLNDTDVLSSTGGARPQILVHIDYQTLAGQLAAHPNLPPPPPVPENLAGQPPPDHLRGPVVSTGAFTGPIDPRVIRAWACDADLIPVVLGNQGEVLDIGRQQRTFPPAIRKAIIARDQGCAAPGCWAPAPWCQVHHIRYWTKHEGPTSADNGVLLCSHHHQALHHDQLSVELHQGVPRVHVTGSSDPASRNHYWHD